ncbi:MAG: hypothetical protein ACF8LK_01390 [Phycisphaerales bacterium JB041]
MRAQPATSPLPALSRREASALLLLLGAGGLSGLTSCGPVKAPRVSLGGSTQPRLVPTSARIDAVPGRTLITPVRVEGPISGAARPRLRLADGREFDGALVWIGVEPDARSWSSWLPAFERWVVAPASDGAIPASLGAWHLVAALSADAGTQPFELNGRTIAVNWLADPDTLRPTDAPGDWEPWRLDRDSPQPDAQLLAPEWRSPLRLWHARLVTTSLGRPTATPGLWQVRGDPGVLDRLAELIEARWRVGLARLWYADETVCRRLLATLGRTVEITPGTHAPAWPTDSGAIESLLIDLLDPRLKGAALAVRAAAWIEAMPQTAVWVEDDAAELLGDTSEPLVRVRAAGLGESPELVWVSGEGDYRVGEPRALEPGGVVEVAVPAAAGRMIAGGRGFTVRSGADAKSVAARELFAIRPPGMRCGPLYLDWTLGAWAASQPGTGDLTGPEHSAVVLLYKDASGWAAFIECASPAPPAPNPPVADTKSDSTEDAAGGEPAPAARAGEPEVVRTRADVAPDELTLWFGQRGRSAAVLRVSRTGVVREDGDEGSEATYAVADEGDRWSVSVPVPAAAIEPGQIVRLGLSRTDPRGVRTAWPRRLMPWDTEPARAAIDLKTWSGLAER